VIYGKYGGSGDKKAKFWLLRAGIEKKMTAFFTLRCGIIIPIIARTATLGNIRNDLPDPKMGGTLGLGVTYGNMTVDLAIYGDPARSYIEQEVRLKSVGSITVSF